MDIFDFLVQYVEEGTDEMRCMIAKFLSCLISDGSLINTQELESIILKNSYSLSRWSGRLILGILHPLTLLKLVSGDSTICKRLKLVT